MNEAVPSVWPLTRALTATNLVAAFVLALADDAEISLIGGTFYLVVLVAGPIVVIATVLGALGYWYRLPSTAVVAGAPLITWMTWGLMIATEGRSEALTVSVLLVAQITAVVVVLRVPERERA